MSHSAGGHSVPRAAGAATAGTRADPALPRLPAGGRKRLLPSSELPKGLQRPCLEACLLTLFPSPWNLRPLLFLPFDVSVNLLSLFLLTANVQMVIPSMIIFLVVSILFFNVLAKNL